MPPTNTGCQGLGGFGFVGFTPVRLTCKGRDKRKTLSCLPRLYTQEFLTPFLVCAWLMSPLSPTFVSSYRKSKHIKLSNASFNPKALTNISYIHHLMGTKLNYTLVSCYSHSSSSSNLLRSDVKAMFGEIPGNFQNNR